MKRWMDQGFFLMRGLLKVGAEMGLTVMADHIKRVINILGVKRMIEAVTATTASLISQTPSQEKRHEALSSRLEQALLIWNRLSFHTVCAVVRRGVMNNLTQEHICLQLGKRSHQAI